MKRNQEDDLTTQSRDSELDHNIEPPEPTSGQRGAGPHSAPEPITIQDAGGHRVTPFQEFDEQAHHHRDPWSPIDETDDAELSTHFGARAFEEK